MLDTLKNLIASRLQTLTMIRAVVPIVLVLLVVFIGLAWVLWGRHLSLDEEKAAKISLQEFYFVNALYFARGSEIDIRHVGMRPFSALTPELLNHTLSRRAAKAVHLGIASHEVESKAL